MPKGWAGSEIETGRQRPEAADQAFCAPWASPESGGLHVGSGLCPTERPSSKNLGWISWIYVILTRTHNKELILEYGPMTAAE